jgi:hypothetical protein
MDGYEFGFYLAEDWDKWLALVNTIMKLQVLLDVGNFLPAS